MADDAQLYEYLQEMVTDGADDAAWEGFDKPILKALKVDRVSKERRWVSFTMTVTQDFCNKLGSMHGGAASTFMDCITSYALRTIAKEGFWDYLGVTRTLTLTFLRPMPLGTELRLEGEVVQYGRKLASLSGKISRVSDGQPCVTCVHDKVMVDFKERL
ncbi:putative thioesterase [Phaeomoniella chlamydospora]|uniref:Putative thioesterase n=1 Tax=Phaeomoniella chlamydospora TaxID=158046 RepID=A0A0G2E4T5_PHACM|nr:putative thioesterase [Phaeomoniella chlamydospora]